MEIRIEGVNKYYYSKIQALKDFNLEIGTGVLGLLGPNGAGKSTLMKILATVIKPTNGQVLLNGESILEKPDIIRSVLGYLPQTFGVYENLTALEFLKYMAALKGLDNTKARGIIAKLLDVVNLSDVASRPLGTYSNGMKQRIGVAQALLNNPQILIIDEPTVGLDPVERINFKNMLAALAGERIIILSTHIVSDIESLASRVVIINQGKLVINARPEELLKSIAGKVWQQVIPSGELDYYRSKYLLSTITYTEAGIELRVIADEFKKKWGRAVKPVLEDAYLYYTSGPERAVVNEIF